MSRDVLEAIDDDHAAILGILHDLERAVARADGRTQRRLAHRLRTALLAHRAAEDHVVYERLDDDADNDDVVVAGRVHHALFEQMLGELDLAEGGGESGARELAALEALFQEHVDHSVHDVRAVITRAIDVDTRRQLADEYAAWREPRAASTMVSARSRSGARSRRAPSRLSTALDLRDSAEVRHGLW